MPDQESGQIDARPRGPPRGVPVYAVESLVLSVLELAWLLPPLSADMHPGADRLLLLPLAVGGVGNVVLCSLVSDNRIALGAFASLALTVANAYAFVFVEATVIPAYNSVFFSGAMLVQLLGSVSLAFLAVHTLLALAAIHDRLWQQTAWIDGALGLLPCLLALACFHTGDAVAGSLNAIVAGLFFAGAIVATLVGGDAPFLPGLFSWRVMFVVTRGLAGCIAVVALATAYTRGLTRWALLVHMSLLLLLFVCRSVGEWREQSELRAGRAQLSQIIPEEPAAHPPANPQPGAAITHRLSQAQLYFPHPVLRTPHLAAEAALLRPSHLAAEAALLRTHPTLAAIEPNPSGGGTRYLRQHYKKRM